MVDPVFPVSPQKADALRQRMARLGIREEDLEESFMRARGKGGQHVNKASTAVQLLHRPTGLKVRCEQERSQGLNRYRARQILCDKLERKLLGEASAEQQRIAKIRRQKRKRSRRAKEKILAEKHARSELKALRAPLRPDGEE
ncbi:MAG: peptide chain release factor-like protein [Candidatus Binatia bacterium]|nr:peptide chain release factor-like protein [Candidatus Binatia bacterium]